MELIEATCNEPVIRHLRSQAAPGNGDVWDLQGWELHVHPDLSERFAQLRPPGVTLTAFCGVHVLTASGVAAGFVQGTSCMYLRLPAEPTGIEPSSRGCAAAFTAPDWHTIDPWQSDFPTEVGLRILRNLTRAAYEFALTLT